MQRDPATAQQNHLQSSVNVTRRFIAAAIAAIALVVTVGASAYVHWSGLVNAGHAESSRLYVEGLWVTRFRLFTEQLVREVPAFSRSPALLDAIAANDAGRVADLVETTFNRLSTRGVIDSLGVFDNSGSMLFAKSDDGRIAEVPIDFLRTALQERRIVSGVGFGLDRKLVAVAVLPLFGRGAAVAGAVVLGESVDLLLQSIADPSRMALAVLDEGGQLRAASRWDTARQLAASLPGDFASEGKASIDVAARTWRAAVQPLRFAPEANALSLVTFTDETEAVQREVQAARNAAVAVVCSIIFALAGIYGFIVRQGERLRQAQANHIVDLDVANRAASDANAKLKLMHREVSDLYSRAEVARIEEVKLRQLNQSILDAAGEGIIGFDASNHISFANPRAVQLLDYAWGDLLNRELSDVIPEFLVDPAAAGNLGKSKSRDDLTMTRKDGSVFPVTFTAGPVDPQNPAGGSVLTFNDISRRKQAEEALAEQEERLRVIIDVVVDGIVIIDERGTIQSVNPAAARIFGYEQGELYGANINQLMGEADSSRHNGYLVRFNASLPGSSRVVGARPREVNARRKDGSMFPVDVAVSDMTLRGKRLFVGVVRDISDRKEVEQKLSRYRDQLEEIVEERTRELIIARDQARSGEQAMATFLANMSHEVRTPLHGILSYAGLGLKKLKTSSPEKLEEYFQEIRSCGTSLLALLNDLLDLSKMRAGKMSYNLRPADMRSVIEKVAREMQSVAEENHISMRVTADETPSMVSMDEGKIVQVVRNLLSNAVKFSHDGGEIEIRVVNDQLKSVSVTVSDQGVGIPSAELESVFDPFIQSTRTRTDAGGTGLGLPICREIIQEGHRGTIVAQNRPDGGTRVTFTIPCQAASMEIGARALD